LHAIDILRFILNSEVVEVRALTDEAPPEYPVDDMAYVILRFDNGACGTTVCGMLAPRSENDAVLYGSKAKLTCKGTLGAPLLGTLGELLVDGDAFNMRMTYPTQEDPAIYRLIREINEFNNYIIEDGREPVISGLNGLQMVKIGMGILESSRYGRSIQIDKQPANPNKV
jgi:predicted dehydrogenase